MKKSTKITIGVLVIFLMIFLFYRNSQSAIKKSLIKNKVAKATREPILGKDPINEFMAKVTEGEIPFVQNKQIANKYDENKTKSSDTLVVKWEEVENPKMEDIRELNEEYAEFIEKTFDARYFKADFTELFKKKVGDKVTLVIDDEEFDGHITDLTIEEPSKMEKEKGSNYLSYSFFMQPLGENLDNVGDSINIDGLIFINTGEYSFEGDINYRSSNGGIKYRFDINNKIGVIIPYNDFDNFLNHKFNPDNIPPSPYH